jgi:hypothetical protein
MVAMVQSQIPELSHPDKLDVADRDKKLKESLTTDDWQSQAATKMTIRRPYAQVEQLPLLLSIEP